jgi:hypothetical protein
MLLNRAKANTPTTGAGACALGAAVAPYQTWAAAGARANMSYSYLIEDGNAWEIGTGLYNGSALSRPGPSTDPTFESSTGALLSLSGSATVACVANTSDLDNWSDLHFSGSSVSQWGSYPYWASDESIPLTSGQTIEIDVSIKRAAGSSVSLALSSDGNTCYQTIRQSDDNWVFYRYAMAGGGSTLLSGGFIGAGGQYHQRFILKVTAEDSSGSDQQMAYASDWGFNIKGATLNASLIPLDKTTNKVWLAPNGAVSNIKSARYRVI